MVNLVTFCSVLLLFVLRLFEEVAMGTFKSFDELLLLFPPLKKLNGNEVMVKDLLNFFLAFLPLLAHFVIESLDGLLLLFETFIAEK